MSISVHPRFQGHMSSMLIQLRNDIDAVLFELQNQSIETEIDCTNFEKLIEPHSF